MDSRKGINGDLDDGERGGDGDDDSWLWRETAYERDVNVKPST